ncbi:polysaccharide deacetylase family protein [Flavobacterium sp. SUN052]|uniref:polysaccharide deacetylase family protein n=1 Tax=Flavobacterium sp. SUN052 TaxID=3002441 RepID=UPI00237DD5CB|nr:polysaccharide deacetylase family protein [Flavobacterium sp. SUN052]MEC4005366.1 polysaccharide deacetylase family protein [Flavobacterium sp. SUN052]
MSRLPILMYHNITPNEDKSLGLTLSILKFEEQLKYLHNNNFVTLFVSQLENVKSIQKKSVVLTFDDVTENQLLFALPLLEKYNMKATFFVPFFYIGKSDLWNSGVDATGEKIMSIDQLKSLNSKSIELGHHSFFHQKYAMLNLDEIQEDFDKSHDLIIKNNLKVYPSLAYPYGNYPKKRIEKEQFFKLLEKNNIKMAFRIGNRVNKFPFKNKFEIQRIDVKGQDSLTTFKWKLRVGKLRLF